jgi:hypothetical protein
MAITYILDIRLHVAFFIPHRVLPRMVFWLVGGSADSTSACDPNNSDSSGCSQVLFECLSQLDEEKGETKCFGLRFDICKALVQCILKQDVCKRRRNQGKTISNAVSEWMH